MARELYTVEPVFRDAVDRCAEILQPHLGIDLRTLLYPDAAQQEESGRQIEETRFAQPALFVTEYALSRLYMSWGIVPDAMLGHSIGEYVAACVSGVFTLEDALALVATRGRLMDEAERGAMLSVPLGEAQAAALLGEGLDLAVVNAAEMCVLAGTFDAIDRLEARLAAQGVSCRRLHTSHAFHSAMMEPALAPFTQAVARTPRQAPQIPFISNVTGTWITSAQATDPAYWAEHLRRTVRFADGLRELLRERDRVLLEVGPGQVLASLAKMQRPKGEHGLVLHSIRPAHQRHSDNVQITTTLGELWTLGLRVDWKAYNEGQDRRRVPLPTYPFERQRYWVDPQPGLMAGSIFQGRAADLADWFYVPSWKRSVVGAAHAAVAGRSGPALVFLDEAGVGAEIAGRLRAAGRDVVEVIPGAAFESSDGARFTIAPGDARHYELLVEHLLARQRMPTLCLHLWGITDDAAY
jgi:acyl transferase domain-containing protein